MRGPAFARMIGFVAVAERQSFAKAAAALDLSTSTLSKEIRDLEASIGVRLLNRTTRSVALTEAGERFLKEVRPALERLEGAAETLNVFRNSPAGVLRLHVPTLAARMVIARVAARFLAQYPAITLDISVDNSLVDIVGSRFDAGIRGMRRISQDMTAVRIGSASRQIAVAAPSYIAKWGRPATPQALKDHNCIRFRRRGAIQRWEFQDSEKAFEVSPGGSFVTDDLDLVVEAALAGIGVGYIVETYVASFIAQGQLVHLLDRWAQPWSGWYVYYPNRQHLSLPLRKFIDFVKLATEA
jgi:DNA-binding transcriptional LysR family regulator